MPDLTRADPSNRFAQSIRKRKEIRHSIGPCDDDHHAERQLREVVLSLELSIHRDEHVDNTASTLQ